MNMKKVAVVLFLAICAPLMAARGEKESLVPVSEDPDKDNVILEIEKVRAPYEKDGFVVFTAAHKARHIGIAFDFERFAQVHSFNVRNMTDDDGEIRDSIMFFVMRRPKGIKTFSYRIVIDGLWACDPNNEDRYYDEGTGLMLSRFTFANDEMPVTEATGLYAGGTQTLNASAMKSTGVRFVLKDKAGQRVRIAGSFTNWDPWIYEMSEKEPGLYEMCLPLPPGTYYYTYYIGMRAFVDRANPNRAYTKDGKTVSVITVE